MQLLNSKVFNESFCGEHAVENSVSPGNEVNIPPTQTRCELLIILSLFRTSMRGAHGQIFVACMPKRYPSNRSIIEPL